jgi:tetratricopeptide (TPR) repeat protein
VLHMTKQKQLKIMKSTLAVLLAGSVTFSGTSAFANSDSESFETVNIDQKETDSTTNVQVNDEANIDSVKEEIEKLEDSSEAPSLLPGDFFYFAKLALEKVKLAFTMDDSKEAKLLAEYAAERLAEAEALFQAGQEDEAIEAINKAIEMMNSFGDKWSDDEVTEEDSSIDENKEGTEKDSATEEEKTEEDTTTEEDTDTDVDTDETTETEEDATEEPADTEETTDETTSEDKETEEMKELMSQNIVALSAALEKVKNPKAKAALQKNIEKSYAKLAEKLAKFEEKWAKEEEEKEEEVTETPEKETTETPTEESTEAPTEETPTEEIAEEGQPVEDKEGTEAAPSPAKSQEKKQEVKAERKANQQRVKEQREERKQEAKEQRDAVKEERKQAKEDRKENRSQTEKLGKNGHGNGNGQQKGNGHKGNGNN